MCADTGSEFEPGLDCKKQADPSPCGGVQNSRLETSLYERKVLMKAKVCQEIY